MAKLYRFFIKVKSSEHSADIQRHAFKLGYFWDGHGHNISHTDKKYIVFFPSHYLAATDDERIETNKLSGKNIKYLEISGIEDIPEF